ncbi:MAG: hypothetical protein EBX36_03800, partial [Planctomycetia bacterium]|nr:hypothetical protein [Planctomycetia bacterium]
MRTTRRGFLGTSLGASAAVGGTAATGFVPYIPWTATAFANQAATDRPRIGCI